jgi:LDH2 family malate/lactate/ureidoglycolate dehydrogenase
MTERAEIRVTPETLHRFAAAVLARTGMPEADADLVAEVLVDTDLRGVRTHGCMLLPNYVQRLECGVVNAKAQPRIVQDAPAAVLLDGDNGMGHLVGVRAIDIAIERARSQGVCLVGVRNSNHYGPAGHYAARAARAGMFGLSASIGSNNAMAPWGGRERLLGNNPVALAAPSGATPMPVLDFANSVVARARIIRAARQGEPIPLGWALDPEGQPTTDSQAGLAGTVVPMAGYKGAGLAYMLGLLAGVMTGAAFGRSVRDQFTDFANPQNIGHVMLAVDIAHFRPLAGFTAEVDQVSEEMRRSAPAPGSDRVGLPGDRSHRQAMDARSLGIEMDGALLEDLRGLADRLGVPRLTA